MAQRMGKDVVFRHVSCCHPPLQFKLSWGKWIELGNTGHQKPLLQKDDNE
jgi:hypothetical protein